jgi:hypothetical protein
MSADNHRVGYTVHIKDRTTGEIRNHVSDGNFEEGPRYGWSDGNFSCDCNRANTFFDDDQTDFPCGDERFVVMVTDNETGNQLYADEYWTAEVMAG